MITVTSIEQDDLASLLMQGAGGLYVNEAAVRLIVRHGYWLRRTDFIQNFVVLYGEPADSAGVRWELAASALDGGELKADKDPANVLRAAASI
jgi:hypothetical protein